MPNRKTKPTSPGRRFATYPLREQLTASEPEKKLTEGLRKSGGRNANGRVTARHRGGGAKRRYRKIDFKRLKDGVPAKVASIEYDPNRSASIALLNYADGEKRYILAPQGLRVGAEVVSEKSYALMAEGKYTFRVHDRAHKLQIAQAVEEIFEVRVRAVRTSTVKSKPKRRGLHSGRSRSWKKAVVQLAPGERIELFEGAETA